MKFTAEPINSLTNRGDNSKTLLTCGDYPWKKAGMPSARNVLNVIKKRKFSLFLGTFLLFGTLLSSACTSGKEIDPDNFVLATLFVPENEEDWHWEKPRNLRSSEAEEDAEEEGHLKRYYSVSLFLSGKYALMLRTPWEDPFIANYTLELKSSSDPYMGNPSCEAYFMPIGTTGITQEALHHELQSYVTSIPYAMNHEVFMSEFLYTSKDLNHAESPSVLHFPQYPRYPETELLKKLKSLIYHPPKEYEVPCMYDVWGGVLQKYRMRRFHKDFDFLSDSCPLHYVIPDVSALEVKEKAIHIGIINYSTVGRQFGLINIKPNSKIFPVMLFYNE